MWLSGQHKRPAESGEGQTGIVTISGGETAVLLDRERRGREVYSPAGYFWTPRAVPGGEGDLKSAVFVPGRPLREYLAALVREIRAGVG